MRGGEERGGEEGRRGEGRGRGEEGRGTSYDKDTTLHSHLLYFFLQTSEHLSQNRGDSNCLHSGTKLRRVAV